VAELGAELALASPSSASSWASSALSFFFSFLAYEISVEIILACKWSKALMSVEPLLVAFF
jgi:hypothetical protein